MTSISGRDGRRIYINEESLKQLARRSRYAAESVFGLVAQTTVENRISHWLYGDAILVHGLPEEVADRIYNDLRHSWLRSTSQLLRSIHKISRRSGNSNLSVPLLAVEEEVANSCHFGSYFTFATTRQAAVRMFADQSSIRDLKRKNNPGANDLTLVSGSGLTLVESQWDRGGPIDCETIEEVKAAVRIRVGVDLDGFVERQIGREKDLIAECASRAYENAFSRGILSSAADV